MNPDLFASNIYGRLVSSRKALFGVAFDPERVGQSTPFRRRNRAIVYTNLLMLSVWKRVKPASNRAYHLKRRVTNVTRTPGPTRVAKVAAAQEAPQS